MPRAFSAAEDAEIVRLKERLPFGGWPALAQDFNRQFTDSTRPWGTLQVRYSRYLNVGKRHRPRALTDLNGTALPGMYTLLLICTTRYRFLVPLHLILFDQSTSCSLSYSKLQLYAILRSQSRASPSDLDSLHHL